MRTVVEAPEWSGRVTDSGDAVSEAMLKRITEKTIIG
jgi:hypothetical protein